MRLSRRRFALAVGGVAATAGCTGVDPTGGNGESDSRFLEGTAVDYPGFLDGGDDEATVTRADGVAVEYLDPERTFGLVGVYEGERDADRLRVTRDLAGDGLRGFVAPAYDDGFTYHAFANGAFVDDATWHFVLKGDTGAVGEQLAEFSELRAGVHHATVTPGGDATPILADRDAAALGEGESDATGIDVLKRAPRPTENGPSVAFSLDRNTDAGTVTITHAGGDALDGPTVVVEVGDEWYPGAFGSTTVTAGDSATVEVSDATARVRVLDVANGSETVLASWG